MSSFKLKYTLEERELECKKIIKKYPTRIPIICEKSKNSNAVNLDKNKYLIPDNFSFSQFIYIIRKRLKLQPELKKEYLNKLNIEENIEENID